MRSVWRIKHSQVHDTSARYDTGRKFVPMNTHAKQSSFTCSFGVSLVFCVYTPINFTKVCKSIVRFVAVNMIDFLRRPFSSHVQPCEPVGQRALTVEHDVDVAVFTKRPRNHANFLASVVYQVRKDARFRAVVRKLAQAFLGNHAAPHQSGKPSEDAASGDESPVPRRVSCKQSLPRTFTYANSWCYDRRR